MKQYVPKHWQPFDWNAFLNVAIEIAKKGKVSKKLLEETSAQGGLPMPNKE